MPMPSRVAKWVSIAASISDMLGRSREGPVISRQH
jgi:hypothetical protein